MTRRRYTEEQKLAVVREAIETGNCAVVGRRHGIAENLVSRSIRQFGGLGESAFTRPAGGGTAVAVRRFEPLGPWLSRMNGSRGCWAKRNWR